MGLHVARASLLGGSPPALPREFFPFFSPVRGTRLLQSYTTRVFNKRKLEFDDAPAISSFVLTPNLLLGRCVGQAPRRLTRPPRRCTSSRPLQKLQSRGAGNQIRIYMPACGAGVRPRQGVAAVP